MTWQKFHSAIRWGKPISELAEFDKALISSKDDKNGNCPIHLAAQNGHLAVVSALLQGGAKVDQQSRNGRTALFMAAAQGQAPATVPEPGTATAAIRAQAKAKAQAP